MTECDMIGHCYNPDEITPRECGRCHEMEKELTEKAIRKGYVMTQPCTECERLARDNAALKWQPIETAPDGKPILVIHRVTGGDDFFLPEVAYRNGDYWFNALGDRMFASPTYWLALEPLRQAAIISAAEGE